VTSARVSIQELLMAKEQLWVSGGCRSNYEHKAMRSTILACTDCGETQEWTLQIYCTAWIKGLLIKGMLSYDKERDTKTTNFAQLGKKLLSPHGRKIGLEFPDHGELEDDATCACESASAAGDIDFEKG
jgi:hypothetical protein